MTVCVNVSVVSSIRPTPIDEVAFNYIKFLKLLPVSTCQCYVRDRVHASLDCVKNTFQVKYVQNIDIRESK
jgi:hypothetical protein